MTNEPFSDDSISHTAIPGITRALNRARSVARLTPLEKLLPSFSPAERMLLYVLTATLAVGALMLLSIVNVRFSTTLPARGGSLVEGETGTARFINPVLATSQADQDITALVFSGLMRPLPDGSMVPDLASSYTISQDGTIYTFTLKSNATFHDGTPVTAQDILFTVQEIQNPAIKSPARADWEGVVVGAPDAHTVTFTLPHAYAPFIENTALGILPSHLWKSVAAEDFPFSALNTHPIGTGPYRVSQVSTDSTGAAVKYDLAPFDRYTLGSPHLKTVAFKFFSDDNALVQAFNTHRIDAIASISPAQLKLLTRTDTNIVSAPLPRVFGVFFNQSHSPVLADASVRKALDQAIDKQAIVNTVLDGYGTPLNGPIPPNTLGTMISTSPVAFNASPAITASSSDSTRIERARATLQSGGWKWDDTTGTWQKGKQTLAFSLATANEPELAATANALAASWKKLGVQVTVQVYPLSDLSATIIRPRNYDAVLFGEIVGRELDLYAFWESKERTDPGLNLSLYTNTQADSLLSQARATQDADQRATFYAQFAGLVAKDTPAVFLYSPDFVYIVPKGLKGVTIASLTTPAERFLSVYQWYTDTERVWDVFVPSSNSQE